MAWVSARRPAWPADDPSALLPVVVQDASSGEVLMLAWANAEALSATQRTGEAHFWSRRRNALWHKGATSGNVLRVRELATDCDGDAILYRVQPAGPACHTGARSCFDAEPRFSMAELERVIGERRGADAATSYTARLLSGGPGRPARKVVEEAAELAEAALAEPDAAVREEAADLAYHLLVTLASRGVSLREVEETLARRHRR